MDLSSTSAAALSYTRAGLRVVPIAHRSKNPNRKEWQNLRLSEEDLPRHFKGRPQNVGVLLGEPSRGLLDVDGDCPEALAVMPRFLPPTDAVFGRPGKPSSHWLYEGIRATPRTQAFEDIDGTMLIELRSTGGQTVFPPSAHADTGEDIRFERQGIAATIDPSDLLRSVRSIAAAALLARRWNQGSRHALALAIAGALLKAGWNQTKVEEFIRAVAEAAGDDEVEDRLKAVATTAEHLRARRPVTGFSQLTEVIGAEAANRLRQWLGLRRGPRSRPGPLRRSQYRATPGGIVIEVERADGTEEIPLTNFTAAITADVVEDDGAEQQRFLELRSALGGSVTEFRIPASSFGPMQWPIEKLGPLAIVEPGFGKRDQARAAIQHLSDPEIPRTTVYTHTGWRRLDELGWVYMHAGGAIGPDGPVHSIETRLDGALVGFELPDPPTGEDLATAVQASMRLIDLGPPHIVIPSFACMFAAALGGTDFGIFYAGPTGAFKTEVAALHQQHFGAGMNRLNLPGAWSSTDNALEDLLFRAKDALLVIDDFKPQGHAAEDGRLHARADRIFRGAGNRAGRQRMRPDASLRPPRPPRGLPFGTGEDLPRGESLRARMIVIRFNGDEINQSALSACQRDAAQGLYAQTMAAFVQWAAGRLDELQQRLRDRGTAIRDGLAASHRRIPTNIAVLTAALEIFADFAAEATHEEALTRAEGEQYLEQWSAVLSEVARVQEEAVTEADPAKRYFELLGSAITSGTAHLADRNGGVPADPEAWGWRCDDAGTGDGAWRPLGDRVGWIDGGLVYVDPAAAYRAAQKLTIGGEGLPVTETGLRRLLKNRGLLARTDESRRKLTCRATLQGSRRDVLAIHSHQIRKPAGRGEEVLS